MKIEQIEKKSISTPITASLDGMQKLFGMPAHTVRRLAKEGAIRRVKLGEGKQSPSLYFVQDMIEYLERTAE